MFISDKMVKLKKLDRCKKSKITFHKKKNIGKNSVLVKIKSKFNQQAVESCIRLGKG